MYVEGFDDISGQDKTWVISDATGQGIYDSSLALSAALPPTGKPPAWGVNAGYGDSPAPDVEWSSSFQIGVSISVGNSTTRSLVRPTN
eukprot:COSAG01_NODE_54587_length_331_cov_0.663793_1_plen_88_part_00